MLLFCKSAEIEWGLLAKAFPNFAAAQRWLERSAFGELSVGRHEIEGDRVFAEVSSYTTRLRGEAQFECHRRYADIQLILSGEEEIYHQDIGTLCLDAVYDGGRDIAFIPIEGGFSVLRVKPDQCAVFLPSDLHAPMMAIGEPLPVTKLVVKVAL